MIRHFSASTLMACALVISACAGDGTQTSSASGKSESPAAKEEARHRDLTAERGTTITLRPDSTITTRRHHVGATFRARSANAVLSESGDTVIPAGARFTGRVTASKPAESPRDSGTLQVTFDRVTIGGSTYPIALNVVSVQKVRAGRGVTAGDAGKVGAGAGAGAIAGRVIGGNARGTVIGGAVGAAAGAIYASESRDIDIQIPARGTIRVTLSSDFRRESQVASN